MQVLMSFLIFNFLFILSCGVEQEELVGENPNFLILIADDAGWRNFGCYGDPYISTPNIDELAANGIKVNNAFLTTPQCSPSRISILTGKYPHATGAEDLHMPLPETEKILPSYLREKNYFTGFLKKGHLGPYGERQFDWYSKDLNDFEIFLDSAKAKTFFMWVGFTDPHRPYKEGIIENPQDPDKVLVPPYLVDDGATRKDLANYYNYIRRMDAQIGKYLRTLRERDLLENTLIIFFSDNGAPFPRAKGMLYDAGIRTPLIFSWPAEIGKGIEYNHLMSVVDLAPTILDIINAQIPSEMQGKSIRGILKNPDLPGRKYVFSERNWHNIDEHMRCVRTKDFKLISNAYIEYPHGTAADISKSPSWKSLYELKQANKLTKAQRLLFQFPRSKYELYRLAKDSFELQNVIDEPEYSEITDELKNVLKNWMDETGDFSPDERRRKDNTDRFTGIKFDMTKLPPRLKEKYR